MARAGSARHRVPAGAHGDRRRVYDLQLRDAGYGALWRASSPGMAVRYSRRTGGRSKRRALPGATTDDQSRTRSARTAYVACLTARTEPQPGPKVELQLAWFAASRAPRNRYKSPAIPLRSGALHCRSHRLTSTTTIWSRTPCCTREPRGYRRLLPRDGPTRYRAEAGEASTVLDISGSKGKERGPAASIHPAQRRARARCRPEATVGSRVAEASNRPWVTLAPARTAKTR